MRYAPAHRLLPPLFLVPPVGVGGLCYAPLVRHLGPDWPAIVLRPPGEEYELGPQSRVEDLAARYVAQVQEAQPEGPILVGGWSTGGVLAFETARQLLAQNFHIPLIFLLDSFLPRLGPMPPPRRPEWPLRLFARQLALEVHGPAPLPVLVQEVLRKGKEAQLLPADMSADQLLRTAQDFAAQLRAVRQYDPLPGSEKILLFRVSSSLESRAEPLQGWDGVASEVGLRVVPGTHYTMLRAPQVAVLAEEMCACAQVIVWTVPDSL